MKKQSKPLPCPFCGRKPRVIIYHEMRPDQVIVGCQTNECAVNPWVLGATREEAIERWNIRKGERK